MPVTSWTRIAATVATALAFLAYLVVQKRCDVGAAGAAALSRSIESYANGWLVTSSTSSCAVRAR